MEHIAHIQVSDKKLSRASRWLGWRDILNIQPGIRTKWFIAEETIGIGKIRLLEKVDELGSISAAARSMGMGYRRAWFLISSLQQGFDAPLIETERGGRGHGGAVVTPLGRELVRRFIAHHTEIENGFTEMSAWLASVQASAQITEASTAKDRSPKAMPEADFTPPSEQTDTSIS